MNGTYGTDCNGTRLQRSQFEDVQSQGAALGWHITAPLVLGLNCLGKAHDGFGEKLTAVLQELNTLLAA